VPVRWISYRPLTAGERNEDVMRRTTYALGIRMRAAEDLIDFIGLLQAAKFAAGVAGHRISRQTTPASHADGITSGRVFNTS
jgi:hypothetical protein